MKKIILLSVVLLMITPINAKATEPTPQEGAIPHIIRFKGMLSDKAYGSPLNGEYKLTFRIYASETDGAMLWEETREGENLVTIADGLLDVELGSITPIGLPFDTQYWLG